MFTPPDRSKNQRNIQLQRITVNRTSLPGIIIMVPDPEPMMPEVIKMIYGHWTLAHQSGLSNNLLKMIQNYSFAWLEQADEGRLDLKSEPEAPPAFCNIMYGKAARRESRHVEIHRQYIDVQLVLAGEELIYYQHANIEPAVIDNPKPDLFIVDMPPLTNCVHLTPGHFAVFFPGEPHQALCQINQCARVKKAVFKIPVDETR